MAIPRADREVLRMQARAGQQGVKAYEAAQAELNRGKQRAVHQAMQEAALRGAPAGAMQSIRGTITSPYRQGAIQLTREQSLYEQDLASRQRRMADYNQAILGARHLIGDETAQAVAPIRAQGRFDVAQINAQTSGRVAELEAQTRLTEAQMRAATEAAKRAAGGGGAGGGGGESIGQSELASSLVAGAEQRVRGAVQRAQDEIQRGIDAAAADAEARKGQASPEAAQSYYYQITHPSDLTPSASRTPTPSPAATAAAGGNYLYDIQHGSVAPGTGADTEARALARNLASNPQRIISPISSAASGLFGGGLGLGVNTGSPLDALQQRAQSAYENVVQNPEIRLPQGGFLTMRQANRIDPLLAFAMEQSGNQGWLTPLRPAEALGGYPEGGPGGQVSPVARDAFQQAMILAAKRLVKQGYEITDPDLQAALSGAGTSLYDPGSTLYDVAQRRQGEPDSREQARIAQDYADQAAADQRQQAEDARQAEEDRQKAIDESTPTPDEVIQIAEGQQRQEFFDKFRVPLPTGAGPVSSVYDVAFNDKAFGQIQQEVLARIQGGDTDIDAILDDLDVADPLYRSMLREMYGS